MSESDNAIDDENTIAKEIRERPLWVGKHIAEAEWESRRARALHALPTRVAVLLADRRSVQATHAILAAQEWADSWDGTGAGPPRIAILAGPHGTGKTVAAAWLAVNRLALQEPRFVTAVDLSYMPRDERRAYFAHGLILDDLGSEHPDARSAWRADIDDLIDHLYRELDCAVITTNLGSAELRARYGDRVGDRIRECGDWIPVVGKSMRGAR